MNVPQVLYKYTTASTSLTILEAGRLRWSSPLLFNDVNEFERMPRFEPSLTASVEPFAARLVAAAYEDAPIDEGRLSPGSTKLLALFRRARAAGATRDDVLRTTAATGNEDDKHDAAVRSYFENVGLGSLRILCLSARATNTAMWEHYAGSFSGCVLGFTHIPEYDTPLLTAHRVAYSADAPGVGSGLDFLLYGVTNELQQRAVDAVCFTKHTDWAYEQEWRCLTARPEEGAERFGDYRFYPHELFSVTFGNRIANEVKASIQHVLAPQYAHAQLFELVQHRGELAQAPVASASQTAAPNERRS